MPPKAKELVRAVRIGMGRASLGTASTGHLASASRQLMVGGAIFSRTGSDRHDKFERAGGAQRMPVDGFRRGNREIRKPIAEDKSAAPPIPWRRSRSSRFHAR